MTTEQHELAESRAFQLRLAERIYLAHQVLAARAEKPQPDPCMSCNATGWVPHGEADKPRKCGLCYGSGER